MAITHTPGGDLQSFTPQEFHQLEAICSRIFPSTADRPGAREVGVARYIDGAVAAAGDGLGEFYRAGLRALDAESMRRFGAVFAELSEESADDLLGQIEFAPDAPTDTERQLEAFFGVVWEHSIQGMWCDPQYGGNVDELGWKLVGFPGAQWGYTAPQMVEGFDSTRIPLKSLDDLRRELRAKNA